MSNQPSGMPSGSVKPKFNIYWIWIAIAAIILALSFFGNSSVSHKTNWDAVKEMIAEGDIQKIDIVNKDLAEVYLKPDAVEKYASRKEYKDITKTGPQFIFNIGSLDYFQNDFEAVKEQTGQDVTLN